MKIKFGKYQALGNSFIVLDRIFSRGRSERFEKLAYKICDPIAGIGADALMVISRTGEKLRFDTYNADGSWAEKSGNGVRVAAMHLYNDKRIDQKSCYIITGSGESFLRFHNGSNRLRTISASLGKPEFEVSKIPVRIKRRFFINQTVKCLERSFIASAVSIGNPHLILFCDNFDFDWESVGEALESDAMFPNRINVGFVTVKSQTSIEVRDWERGVGPTKSSGTGAAAAVAVAVMRGFTGRTVEVLTRAGKLEVSWDEKTDDIFVKGPVEYICSGEFYLK